MKRNVNARKTRLLPPLTRTTLLLLAVLFGFSLLTTMASAQIFTENFSGINRVGRGTQCDTGLNVYHGTTVPGWTGAGTNHSHAVDISGASRLALTLFGGVPGNPSREPNELTLNTAFAANENGVVYSVSYEVGPSCVFHSKSRTRSISKRALIPRQVAH